MVMSDMGETGLQGYSGRDGQGKGGTRAGQQQY